MRLRPSTRAAEPAATGWRRDVAAGALGGLAALALPPLFLLPVLLVAVPGLIGLIDGAGRARTAFRIGFWFGFGHHLIGLYWITDAILIEAARYWWFVPLAVPGLAAILAPFIGLACAIAWSARRGWPRVLALAGAWTLADLARQFVGTGFPWNPWGSVWALPGLAGDVLLQPLAWIGTPGLTMLTVLAAAAPVFGRRGWFGLAAGLAAWAALGALRLAQPAGPPPGLHVVLAQGDIAQGQKWDQALAERIFTRYIVLSQEALAPLGPGPAVVIWPETASPFLLQTDALARAAIADGGRATTLAGTVRFDEARRPRNSLVVVSPSGAAIGLYDKWHLVPGGEYMPSWLPIRIVPGGGFAAGDGPRPLTVPGVPKFGALICYEAIFPHQVIDETDRPEWMVNITNDAWFGDSSGPRQHLAAARMRAVEEGLPLVRAANTGISAGFDAHGRELVRLGLGREGTRVLDLPGTLPPTLFGRFGLGIPAGLALLLLGLAWADRVLSRKPPETRPKVSFCATRPPI